jgi:hypothetical protein
MTTLASGIVVPKYYIPGYGYSTATGPQVGGYGVGANPNEFSSTFFGSNIKALLPSTAISHTLPPMFNFSKKAKKNRKTRKSIKNIKNRKSRKSIRKSIKGRKSRKN